MATYILKVSLIDERLDVEETNLPEDGVPRGELEDHVISWVLDDASLPDACFEQGYPLALTWISTAPRRIFSKPLFTRGSRCMSVHDTHIGTSTGGHFVYMLRVRADPDDDTETYYTTTHTPDPGSIRTTNNPVIINH
jgi:hypothetical protein